MSTEVAPGVAAGGGADLRALGEPTQSGSELAHLDPSPITPTIHSVLVSAAEGHWLRSVGTTLVITLWASALAIALPPLLLLLLPSQIAQHLQRFSWRLCESALCRWRH